MAALSLLPDSTIHRIASSQVITSISTAIKELVENSLDAGADNIEVKLEDYGFSRIEVRDNGCGVKAADVAYMAQRHYTSKINTFENLNELTTYGFRGEALCSLCSVGSVAITTKTKDNAVAQCFTLGQAGKILSTKPTPSSVGTTVVVNNLFKNLPVRKQFLSSSKKCKEELKKVEELVMAFGSVHPGIRIVLRHNKSIIWQKSKVSDYKTALMSVFGTSIMANMERIDYKDEENKFEILGYLPKPDSDPNVICRTNNDRSFVFINDRPVVIKEVSKFVRQYYFQAGQKFPVMFLKIKLPPDEVDVNLEPNKTRVLLSEKDHILEVIKNLLAKFYEQELPNNILASGENGHSNGLKEKVINENQMDILENNCDFQIEEMFNPIASSTLNSTACENLQNENLPPTDLEKETQINLNGSNFNHLCKKSITGIENVLRNTQPDGNICGSDEKNNSAMSGAMSSSLINGSNYKEDVEKYATRNNVQENKDLSACNTTLTDKQSSSMMHKEDKDSNMTEQQKLGFPNSNPENTADLNNFDSESRLTENSIANTKEIPVLNKEDMDNIQKLLDLTDNSQQVSDIKNSLNTQELQSMHFNTQTHNDTKTPSEKNNSSLDFDDVLDDDLEFDQILKDFAEKKMLSQPKQMPDSSSQDIQAKSSSQEIQVAKENNCSKPHDICNKVSGKSWSAGNVLKDKQGNLIEPVGLLVPSVSIKHNKTTPLVRKRKHSSDKDKKPQSNRKIQHIPQVLNQSLITFHASQSPKERLNEAEKINVSFSMLNLKNSYKPNLGIKQFTPVSKYHLIGWMEPSGVWLVLQGTDVLYVNHFRIQEQILYHKLIQTHVLPREKLEKSIQLSPSIVGDECWDILINLESQSESQDSTRVIIDERVKSNGFDVRIKVDSDTNEERVDVLGISTSLPFYGTPDLTEILGLIKKKGMTGCSLADCRPLKVVNYLKGEAVRICRAQNPRITKEDMEALLLQMDEFLPKDIQSCLHEHPFFGQIADISSYL